MVRVRNLISPNGNTIPNQFEIEVGNWVVFQSYETIIGAYNRGSGELLLLDGAGEFSRTTSKYLYIWLQDNGFNITNKKELLKIREIYGDNVKWVRDQFHIEKAVERGN